MSGIIDGAYDKRQKSVTVETAQRWFRDSFNGQSVLDASRWDVSVGSGMTVAITAGVLTITTGTDINSETIITSKESFLVPMRLHAALRVPTRIANQEFYFELVSVDELAEVPDNVSTAGWKFAGATLTAAEYVVSNHAPVQSGAATIATSATNSVYEIEAGPDEVWFHQRGLDTNGVRSPSFVRHRDIPDPNSRYKIRIRVKNLATAPVSSTALECLYVALNSYSAVSAELIASRGGINPGGGFPVSITYNPGGINYPVLNTSYGTATFFNLLSAASTNATLIRGSVLALSNIHVSNTSASWRFVKFYNKATAPVPGTDTPLFTVAVPPNGSTDIPFSFGVRFTLGLGVAITGGNAPLDATAVGAGEVLLGIGYL